MEDFLTRMLTAGPVTAGDRGSRAAGEPLAGAIRPRDFEGGNQRNCRRRRARLISLQRGGEPEPCREQMPALQESAYRRPFRTKSSVTNPGSDENYRAGREISGFFVQRRGL